MSIELLFQQLDAFLGFARSRMGDTEFAADFASKWCAPVPPAGT